MSQFPQVRLRRTRKNKVLRDLVAENAISASQLVLPLFVRGSEKHPSKVDSMDGVFRHSLDEICKTVEESMMCGIKSFAVFPFVDPSAKSADAKESYDPDNLVCKAIRKIKEKFGSDTVLIADVALDPYTIDGHDGITKDGVVLNDATLEVLCKQSLVLAASGADIIAPSDMMDGRIAAIRHALDIGNFYDVVILSYAAKYASCLYFPFRDAVGSGSAKKIDKSSYQLDFRNFKEAITEIEHDITESADIIMIKPATFYLDVIKEASQKFNKPIFAYQVSGEYQMFKKHGGIEMLLESLIAIKRAGATSILTYAAVEVAKFIAKDGPKPFA